MKRTQNARVLYALRVAGPRGITQVDWLLPNVLDGGSPITRLPSRIADLKAAGHRIETAGRRQRCTIYVLVEPTTVPLTSTVSDDDGAEALFEPAHRALSAYDPRAES